MQYLLLIYQDETTIDPAMFPAYKAFTESIKASGHYIGGNPLESVKTATSVRVRSGRTAVTDGPFAETREQLGGYYLVEAAHLDDATAIAARIPSAVAGTIEVRPIMTFHATA
jgi:hypothetical protein